jgi:hypothetical protein
MIMRVQSLRAVALPRHEEGERSHHRFLLIDRRCCAHVGSHRRCHMIGRHHQHVAQNLRERRMIALGTLRQHGAIVAFA